jgi:hypothetical protein
MRKQVWLQETLDVDDHDNSTLIVSAGSDCVGVCLSKAANGDVEVWLSVAVAAQLAEAVSRAIRISSGAEAEASEGGGGKHHPP